MQGVEISQRDDRSDSFRMIGDIISSIAKNQGVEVDEKTLNRWRDTLGLLREFDTFADDMGISHDIALRDLSTFERFAPNYPSLAPPELPAQTHKVMVSRVEKILNHGQILASTDSVSEFIYNRKEEVDETAELLADCATGDVLTQPGFYTRFMPVLRTMGRAANFLDTLTDHRQDIKEDKVRIKGTQQFYMAVGRQAINNLALAIPQIVHPNIMRQFWDMSLMRLRNRLVYGKTPYSSLRNVSRNKT